jgi:O-antigen ligase
MSHRSRRLRYLVFLCVCFLILGILATLSRGGLIALLVVSAVLLVKRIGRKPVVWVTLIGMVVVVFGLVSSDIFPQLHYAELLGQKRMLSVYYRAMIFKAGLNMLMDYPLIGVGVGNFMESFGRYSPIPRLLAHPMAHNSYLEVACETGLLGFIFFLSIVGIALANFESARRKFKALNEDLLLRITEGLEVGFVGYLVAHFFASAQYAKHFWLLVALSSVLLRLHKGRNEVRNSEPSIRRI